MNLMKIISAFAFLMLTACAAAHPAQPVALAQTAAVTSPVPSSPTPAPTATSTLPPASIPYAPGRPTPGILAGFVEPEPETWVDVMPAVREYFYYRKKAMVAGDVSVLWQRYPDLSQGMDVQAGVNVEQAMIRNYSGLKLFDGNIFPEHYERIKVKMSGDTAEVLVHGIEMYLVTLEPGKFDESGGEFQIILALRKQDNLWTVYKTTRVGGV